jgi:hypothetical protein
VSFTFRYVSSFKIGANHAEPTGNRDLVKPDRLGAFSVARDLGEYRFEMITPPGNESAIVTFEHGGDNDDVANTLARAGIDATVRGESGQIRVGPALFNNSAEIERFLEVAGSWDRLGT